MTKNARVSTGVPGLDERLGGGLIPGATTVLVGGSGIGKTQFGLQFLNAGLSAAERRRGVLLDLTARGDSQNHAAYAKSLFDWDMTEQEKVEAFDPALFFSRLASGERVAPDYFHAFTHSGRRVTKRDLDEEDWREWKCNLTRRLDATIAFIYGNFTQGARRLLVDGVEPVERQGESIQFELLEYVDRQIVKKDAAWVARDLFRQNYRDYESQIAASLYSSADVATLLSYTSPENSLEALIERPLEEGDFFAQANTVICMGKIRDGLKFRRALYVLKHRGSACSDDVIFYEIDDAGLKIID
ncbi:MAG: recombinase RecA [Thermoguttaceae bacterium]|nr:recombinase RecA [Thermoguttaceae bacterium]